MFYRHHGLLALAKKVWEKVTAPPWSQQFEGAPYRRWLKRVEPSPKELERQRNSVPKPPDLSLIILESQSESGERTKSSLDSQSVSPKEVLFEGKDFPSPLSEYALEALQRGLKKAKGKWVAWIYQGDQLSPEALFCLAGALEEDPPILYTDEDCLDENGERCQPKFKAQWSPETLESFNYFGGLVVVKKSLLKEILTQLSHQGPAWDYALWLRAVQKADKIRHLPHILYHRRPTEDLPDQYFLDSAQALRNHLRERESSFHLELNPRAQCWTLRRTLPRSPLISILIPTCDQIDLLDQCLKSILSKSTYLPFEILLLENNSRQRTTFQYYRKIEKKYPSKIRLLIWEKDFHYAAINNFGAHQARGEVLLLLNNDTEVITADWLERMAEEALRPEIGAVGAKLLYRDETVQHGGVILGLSGLPGGVAGHALRDFPRHFTGAGKRLVATRNVSAVTGACLMVKKELYEKVEGLDEKWPVAYNDVDFCLKLLQIGCRNVMVPTAELYHWESRSRGYEITEKERIRLENEARLLRQKWGQKVESDPYYHPLLTSDDEDFSLG